MAKKIKKKCCVCGCEYEIYCPTCREAVNQPSWMNIFHDENCKKIYETTSAYIMGMMTAESAKRIFDKCDLNNKDNFNKKFKNSINEVYELTRNVEEKVDVVASEDIKVELAIATVTESENGIIDLDINIDNEVTTENKISAKTNNYKKRKKKNKNKMIDSD